MASSGAKKQRAAAAAATERSAYGLPHRSLEEYDAMSFDSIKAEAEQHGLSSDGIRAVVIARLIGRTATWAGVEVREPPRV